MKRTRLPAPGAALRADTLLPLSEASLRHLTVLRRLEPGAPLVLFDGAGAEADAELEQTESGWRARIVRVREGRVGAPVTLCYALPKGDKLESVARQATELGVDALVLVAAARSVSKLAPDRARKKRARLERVMAEAARQCGRADVPSLSGPLPVAEACAQVTERTLWVLHPDGGEPLAAAPAAAALAVFVGPEGGFAPAELDTLAAAGAARISLACPVLRTETAAIVGAALALEHLGAL